jgi:hypothetical protein
MTAISQPARLECSEVTLSAAICGGALDLGNEIFGENNYMWPADFLHPDCTGPRSRKVIAQDFANIPDAATRKIVCDIAPKLYGFPSHLGMLFWRLR